MGAFAHEVKAIRWSCHDCNLGTKMVRDTPKNREIINRSAEEHDRINHPDERSLLSTEGRLTMAT